MLWSTGSTAPDQATPDLRRHQYFDHGVKNSRRLAVRTTGKGVEKERARFGVAVNGSVRFGGQRQHRDPVRSKVPDLKVKKRRPPFSHPLFESFGEQLGVVEPGGRDTVQLSEQMLPRERVGASTYPFAKGAVGTYLL